MLISFPQPSLLAAHHRKPICCHVQLSVASVAALAEDCGLCSSMKKSHYSNKIVIRSCRGTASVKRFQVVGFPLKIGLAYPRPVYLAILLFSDSLDIAAFAQLSPCSRGLLVVSTCSPCANKKLYLQCMATSVHDSQVFSPTATSPCHDF